MSEPTTNDATTTNLLTALLNLPQQTPPEPIYRLFFDPATGICSHKTADTKPATGAFVEIDRAQYDAVTFCPQWVVKDGAPMLIPVDLSPRTVLQCNTAGRKGWETIRDNMVFRVDEGYLNDTDCWSIRGYNDE